MPLFRMASYEVDVSREALLIDTNVLFAAFCKDDEHHADARTFIDDLLDYVTNQLLVPMPVIVEAWGLLVGSRNLWEAGYDLLNWLGNPGNATVLPDWEGIVGQGETLVRKLRVDLVDAVLACVASEVSEQCRIQPPIRIATFDCRDFYKCLGVRRLKLRIYDLNTLDEIP